MRIEAGIRQQSLRPSPRRHARKVPYVLAILLSLASHDLAAQNVCHRCDALTFEVQAFLEDYFEAMSARDTARVRAAYIGDGRFAWVERGRVQYRAVDDVIAGFASLPAGPIRTDISDLEVNGVGGSAAVARMRFTTTIGSGTGAFSFGGLMTIVLERDDGWRIVTGQVSETQGTDSGPDVGQTLGTVAFETSCSPDVAGAFNHAIALLHHMTYTQARTEFAAITDADPGCAIAHWGIAMTLFQPLWPTRPTAADLERGLREVREAQRIGATAREMLYIATARAFFDPSVTDYAERIRRWAAATERLAEAHPGDREARAFLALARLASAGVAGNADTNAAAAAILDGILQQEPSHPGAIHYTIHANDATGREHESLAVVRRYAEVAPRNPHALHMPTHIYVRLGEWSAVIAGNEDAAEAALEHPAGDRGQWVWDEFPHAVEYLVYAALQQGDDDAAFRALTRLRETADLQPTFKTAFHLASIPARYTLERRDWTGAMALEPRPSEALDWSRFPWPEAITWFAKGLGAARSGDAISAGRAAERIARLRDASERLGETPFARQTEVLRLIVDGWLYYLGDNPQMAVDTLRRAAALEASLPKPPVTPAPTLPALEVLGDLLLEVGRPAEALAAYRACLETAPGRFDSLVGAARAARALREDDLAGTYYRALLDQVVADSPRPEVQEAKAFTGVAP